MRKLNQLWLFFFTAVLFNLFFMSSVVAYSDMKTMGDNGQYESGFGNFNSNFATPSPSGIDGVSNSVQDVLMSDIDNDGNRELLVVDGNTYTAYRGKFLIVNASYTISEFSASSPSTTILYDIDGDSESEIITSSWNTNQLYILDYTTSGMSEIINLTLDGKANDGDSGQVILGCRAVGECVAVYTRDRNANGGNALYSLPFDVDRTYNRTTLASSDALECFSGKPSMSVYDHDGNGNTEFLFSWAQKTAASSVAVYLVALGLSDPMNTTILDAVQVMGDQDSNPNYIAGAGAASCDEIFHKFTNVMIADVDQGQNGAEGIIGATSGAVAKGMYVFNIGGGDIADPIFAYDYFETQSETSTVDYMSNPFLMDWTGSSTFLLDGINENDFCVTEYITGDSMYLSCATFDSTIPTRTSIPAHTAVIGSYDLTNSDFNVTPTTDTPQYYFFSHGGKQDQSIVEDSQLDEAVTPLGVFKIIDFNYLPPLTYFQTFDIEKIWDNPYQNTQMFPVDAQSSGRNDMVIAGDDSIYYIDDGFSNSGATVTNVFFNPCYTDTWKENTTVEIRITAEDIDGNSVSSKATLYADSTNEIVSNWTTNVSSGSTMKHLFSSANKSVNNGIARIQARDTGNPDDVASYDFIFAVAQNGVEYGDTSCDFSVNITSAGAGDNETGVGGVDLQDNPINNFMTTLNEGLGLNLGTTIWWLLFMVAAAMGILAGSGFNVGSGLLFAVGLVEGLLLVMGTILGFIPIGIVIVITVIGVAVIAVTLRGHATGT